jgi:hypothetical protein
MLKAAETASSPEARAEFLALADRWLQLARSLEEPKW